MENYKREALERMARFISGSSQGCTSWTGGKDQDGYPMFWFEGKTERASRVLWQLIYGEIPIGIIVRHTCDNRECLQLNHLLLGSKQDNSNDAKSRNRLIGPRKVSTEVAMEINRRRVEGWPIAKIAAHFKISIRSVHNYLKVSSQ